RSDMGILIAQRKACFPLVWRQEIETLEFEDVAPAARDLAVRYLELTLGNRAGQDRNRRAVEDAVPKIAEHQDVGRDLLDLAAELGADPVRNGPVVERVDLQHAI